MHVHTQSTHDVIQLHQHQQSATSMKCCLLPLRHSLSQLGNIYSVRRKKTPLNKYHCFQYISIFFYDIFRDYSGHNLPLLLQLLSSQPFLYLYTFQRYCRFCAP